MDLWERTLSENVYSQHGYKQGVKMESFGKQISTDSHSNLSIDSHNTIKWR